MSAPDSGPATAPTLRWGGAQTGEDGVVERDFELELLFEGDLEKVPGVLWCAEPGAAPRTLVMAGHGFCVHKRLAFPLPVLRALVSQHGCAVAVLDAPGHGDRRADPTQPAQATADAYQAHWGRFAGSRIAREMEAACVLLQQEPEIADGPVGYWGLSLATQYGLAWLSETERCGAAVLGLFGGGRVVAHYARRVRCPVFFVQQLGDEIHPEANVRALFDEIASPRKELAASPGAHVEVPDAVCERAVAFLLGNLER